MSRILPSTFRSVNSYPGSTDGLTGLEGEDRTAPGSCVFCTAGVDAGGDGGWVAAGFGGVAGGEEGDAGRVGLIGIGASVGTGWGSAGRGTKGERGVADTDVAAIGGGLLATTGVGWGPAGRGTKGESGVGDGDVVADGSGVGGTGVPVSAGAATSGGRTAGIAGAAPVPVSTGGARTTGGNRAGVVGVAAAPAAIVGGRITGIVNGACARTASVGTVSVGVAIAGVAIAAVLTGATADGALAVVTGRAMVGATGSVGTIVSSIAGCTAMASVGVTADDPPRPKTRYPTMTRIATPSIAVTPIKNASSSLFRLGVSATGGERGYGSIDGTDVPFTAGGGVWVSQ